MQKTIIVLGIILIVIGLTWPWLSKIPIGRLPGDIVINKPQMKIYFPVTTMIIMSVLISFILWLFKK